MPWRRLILHFNTRRSWVVNFHATAALSPGRGPPDNLWIGGWVNSSTKLEVLWERECSCPYRKPSYGFSVIQPAAYWLYHLRYPDSVAFVMSRCNSLMFLLALSKVLRNELTAWRTVLEKTDKTLPSQVVMDPDGAQSSHKRATKPQDVYLFT
jgi:hypothetical protein